MSVRMFIRTAKMDMQRIILMDSGVWTADSEMDK